MDRSDADLASAISSTVAFLGLLALFVRDNRRAGHPGPLHVREFLRLLRFGIPSGFNWFFEFVAFVFFISVVVAGLGTAPLAAFMQVFDAAASVLAETLRAAGDTAFVLWARTAIAWGFFAPGSWISVRVLGGGAGVTMFWLVVYLALLAVVLFVRFRAGAWRRIELVEPFAL